jgi:aryl-alcohol dehydrogenase-like predicted oxidoreductase
MERKLGIGTAQFGLDYGISNRSGRTPSSDVARVLADARQAEVRWLDTAPAYGVSESVLGEVLWPAHGFDVTTKTPRLGNEAPDPARHLRRAFSASLLKLRQERLYGLLFHCSEDLLGPSGKELFSAAMELKAENRVAKVGVSVYTAAEIEQVCDRFAIDLIQVPLSVLDQRLLRSGHLDLLAKQRIEIHARSIFLQGLMMMDPDQLDARFDGVKCQLRRLREAVSRAGSSLIAAALCFVCGLPQVSAAICGVNSPAQFSELLREEACGATGLDYSEFAAHADSALDPRLWEAK